MANQPIQGTVQSWNAITGIGVLRADDGREVAFSRAALAEDDAIVQVGRQAQFVVTETAIGLTAAFVVPNAN